MELEVEHIDLNNVTSHKSFYLPFLGFIKHLAVAGQGYAPKPEKLMRTLGMLLHFYPYMRWKEFYQDKFSEPPIILSDPTEKGQFSNLAGKAIADFLSKRIDKSLFTVNYEAAMRIRNMAVGNVSRPDLMAFTQKSMFAIEAKGFSGGYGNMAKHKMQSKNGGIPVNFTVACISYNLYSKVKCKYYDPYNEEVNFDLDSFTALTKIYYSGLEGFLDESVFPFREVEISNESFYEIDLFDNDYRTNSQNSLFHEIRILRLLSFYRPRLILPRNIRQLAKSGLSTDVTPFREISGRQETRYIDYDRVGLVLDNI